MNKQTHLTGYLLILAAITFWISWFLMPDPGTTDTNHILTIVKQARVNVLCSVIIQICSSVLYIVSLILLARQSSSYKKGILVGISLLGIGAMGLCADAFFHLLAYFMTDDTVHIQQDVVSVMTFMQTAGVIFLIPLLLPLFIGSLVLASSLKRQALVSRVPEWIFIAAFLLGIVSAIANKTQLYTGTFLTFIMLGLFAMGQALIGVEWMKVRRNTKLQLKKVRAGVRNQMQPNK